MAQPAFPAKKGWRGLEHICGRQIMPSDTVEQFIIAHSDVHQSRIHTTPKQPHPQDGRSQISPSSSRRFELLLSTCKQRSAFRRCTASFAAVHALHTRHLVTGAAEGQLVAEHQSAQALAGVRIVSLVYQTLGSAACCDSMDTNSGYN